MSVSDTIAGLPYLSKQEILMKLSQELGKSEEARRTFELLVSIAKQLPWEDIPNDKVRILDKAQETLEQIDKDMLLNRSIIHHLT